MEQATKSTSTSTSTITAKALGARDTKKAADARRASFLQASGPDQLQLLVDSAKSLPSEGQGEGQGDARDKKKLVLQELERRRSPGLSLRNKPRPARMDNPPVLLPGVLRR